MSDRFNSAGLVVGVLGLGVGAAGAITEVAALAVAAGVCALGAGVLAWCAGRPLQQITVPAAAATTGADGRAAMNGEPDHVRPQDTTTSARFEVDAATERTPAEHRSGDHATGHRAEHRATDDTAADVVASDQARADETGSTGPTPSANGAAPANSLNAGEDDDALVDADTGLFTEGYFKVAVEMRIAAARRRLRPVAVVLLDVVREVGSPDQRPGVPTSVSRSIRETLREADTASRLDDGRYALVLEDTPESGAIWTVERLRSRLVEAEPDHTVWAGVACYPAHAFDTAEILSQAEAALELAREWRQDRIEVATAD
ncbi:MAG: diguanylate cyclase [Actinomycetota bacterium]|nr:diguanylate cyclase [Actinomycetota bacterium]